uniref:Uncharacterized protein n=1 Tax=Tanacetum cinerariifolium TaxID=118510 RepID=A0A699H5L8_TANCI|nr:hypothetical protein [Tanacetum cinerariifolium]
MPPYLFTGGKVEGEQGATIHVVLFISLQIRLSTNTERLRPSESSNKKIIKNDVVTKDGGLEKNDVECSQDKPSIGDLEAKTNETITNDENTTEKEASDKTGQRTLNMKLKKAQEKDKIRSKPNKNRKCGEAGRRGKIKELNVPGNDPMAIEDENEQLILSTMNINKRHAKDKDIPSDKKVENSNATPKRVI